MCSLLVFKMSPYTSYYLLQAGGGSLSDLGIILRPRRVQRGSGLFGSLLSGAYKFAKPLFIQGLHALASEGMNFSQNFLNDLSNDQKPKEILKNQGKQSLTNLKEKLVNKLNNSMQQQGQGKRMLPIPINYKADKSINEYNFAKIAQLSKARALRKTPKRKTPKKNKIVKKQIKKKSKKKKTATKKFRLKDIYD
jgi:hypothetical protein